MYSEQNKSIPKITLILKILTIKLSGPSSVVYPVQSLPPALRKAHAAVFSFVKGRFRGFSPGRDDTLHRGVGCGGTKTENFTKVFNQI